MMPPEPKFKLGQEVVYRCQINRVMGVQIDKNTDELLYYVENCWHTEKELSLPKRKVKAYCYQYTDGSKYYWHSDMPRSDNIVKRIPAMDFEVEVPE